MRATLSLFFAINVYLCHAQEPCTVKAGKWSRWSTCRWMLVPCAIIAWPDTVVVKDTVEWRWVQLRTAPNKLQPGSPRPCRRNTYGRRSECRDCVPAQLMRRE
ncbi:MAG: hypothetical protein QY325_04240 [Flavobacteriales bacterium]|nr:MAG: hypothetical protein QY325_04240 [Flavobacteriales bacterium]